MLYISYYTFPEDIRYSSPAANSKIVSISNALASNGQRVEIVSTSLSVKDSKTVYVHGCQKYLNEHILCHQFGFFNTNNRILKRLQQMAVNLRIFLLLLFKTHKNENVLMYHAIERSMPVLVAKAIKKFRLLLEVEEIYGDALHLSEKQHLMEEKIISAADAYIFPTELLNRKLNTEQKPYAIICGTYESAPIITKPANDGITHLVYSGTLDRIKGGAYAAIDAAKFLDDGFHIHILGFGSTDDVELIQQKIREHNLNYACSVTYDGCLLGEAYDRFLQTCHIGLSTQDIREQFNDTSFPSKILTYMANGLNVVSGKIPVVVTSPVNQYMSYYEKQEPEQIASAIRKATNMESCNNRIVVNRLKKKFEMEICEILG